MQNCVLHDGFFTHQCETWSIEIVIRIKADVTTVILHDK